MTSATYSTLGSMHCGSKAAIVSSQICSGERARFRARGITS